MTIHLNAGLPRVAAPEAPGKGVHVALGASREDDAVGANITRDVATDAFLESFTKRSPVDRLLAQPGQLDRFLAPE